MLKFSVLVAAIGCCVGTASPAAAYRVARADGVLVTLEGAAPAVDDVTRALTDRSALRPGQPSSRVLFEAPAADTDRCPDPAQLSAAPRTIRRVLRIDAGGNAALASPLQSWDQAYDQLAWPGRPAPSTGLSAA